METNLQAQYEQIEKVIGEYRSFIRKAIWRGIRPLTYIKILIMVSKVFAGKRSDVSRTDKKNDAIKRMSEIVYSEDERRNPFYEIGIGPYSLHKLSYFVEQNFPEISYENLLKMHEISDIKIKAGSPAKLFGYVLAIGSLFLKTVPQAVVESFKVDYTNYQIVTFWVFIGALAYISLFIGVWYATGYRHNKVSKLAKEVIEYTVARIKAQSPNKANSADAKSSAAD